MSIRQKRRPQRHCRLCGQPEKHYAFGYSNLTPYSQICAECVNRVMKQTPEEQEHPYQRWARDYRERKHNERTGR